MPASPPPYKVSKLARVGTQIQAQGIVYRALCPPLIVNYVVYEQERVVIVLDVLPYPNKGLDADHPAAE